MDKLLLLLSILFIHLLASCTNTVSDTPGKKEKDTLSYIPVDPAGKTTSNIPPAPQPSSKLIAFTKEIEKMNWVDDTARLHKVKIYPQLPRENVLFFEGQAFYPIPFEESKIYKYIHHPIQSKKRVLDVELFRQVNNIWGYFYRKQPVETSNPDGIIEQWEFADSTLAQQAYEMISDPLLAMFIYVNTRPYFTRIDNSLYIFHARASAFSYYQKEVFELFVNH